MADDMNRVPEAHFRKLMQEAKDAAMADGELDDTEKLALENPKDRVRKMLQKSAEEIASDQKMQHRYSDIFHSRPPPGLFYAEAVLQPADDTKYVPLPGDGRPRWMPACVSESGIAAAMREAAALAASSKAPIMGSPSPKGKSR